VPEPWALGLGVRHLPACSPDLNPIEWTFAKLKAAVRNQGALEAHRKTPQSMECATEQGAQSFLPKRCHRSLELVDLHLPLHRMNEPLRRDGARSGQPPVSIKCIISRAKGASGNLRNCIAAVNGAPEWIRGRGIASRGLRLLFSNELALTALEPGTLRRCSNFASARRAFCENPSSFPADSLVDSSVTSVR
jgi:hypothetical protein